MEQEVYLKQDVGKGRSSITVVGAKSAGFHLSSSALLEQPLESDVAAAPPADILPVSLPSASALAEGFIRGFDLGSSIFILLLLALPMLLSALLIKLTSDGSIFYKQRRVGKNGKIFVLYKFRTMIKNAEKHTGPVWAVMDDDRVTRLGRFLRRTRLDELPQLFNVLRGDMSLVGPRPERPYFVRRHRDLQGVRLTVKPGITGLAQIRALYDLRPEHKLKYDYLYIQKRSFILNAYIILKTVPVVLLRKGW